MLDYASKTFFHLSPCPICCAAASHYGMRQPSSFARRFIAGETVEEAVATARDPKRWVCPVTPDYLR